MTLILAAAFFLLLLPAACLGWGLGFRRVTGMARGRLATTISLGVATIIFIGGWLNWLELAHAPAVLAVLFLGVGAPFFLQQGRPMVELVKGEENFGLGALVLAIAVVLLLVLTQLPPGEYNPADDLQKYFTWPTRMLATGTMVFSSTSAIGAESLGGQAVLHGAMLAILSPIYLAGVDSIFGMALCLLLALSVTRHRLGQLLGVLAILLIHPQVVNISTVYLGSALIMAALATAGESSERSPPGQAILYAALIACKPTFAIFVGLHAIAAAILFSDFRRAARFLVHTGAWGLFFLTPWILLHGPHWFSGLAYRGPPVDPPYQDTQIGLFSADRLFYGGSLLAYSSVVFGSGFVSGLVVWFTRREIDATLKPLVGAALILPIGYLTIYYVSGPLLIGQSLIVRYYTPVIIGLVAVMIGLSFSRLPDSRFWIASTGVAFAIPLALFAPSFGHRVGQMVTYHNQLSYRAGSTGHFRPYNSMVLTGITKQRLAEAQNMIPAGAPFLAWVDTAYQLDFSRNPIHDVETAGTSNPWAEFPKVRYVLWEKGNVAASESRYLMVNSKEYRSIFDQGYHERQIAARWIDFYRCVDRLTREGRLIAQQGTLFVYELKPELEAPLKF